MRTKHRPEPPALKALVAQVEADIERMARARDDVRAGTVLLNAVQAMRKRLARDILEPGNAQLIDFLKRTLARLVKEVQTQTPAYKAATRAPLATIRKRLGGQEHGVHVRLAHVAKSLDEALSEARKALAK